MFQLAIILLYLSASIGKDSKGQETTDEAAQRLPGIANISVNQGLKHHSPRGLGAVGSGGR